MKNKIFTIAATLSFFMGFAQQDSYQHDNDKDTLRRGTIKIEKKYTEADFFPRINGKFTGEIHPLEVCHKDGIQTNAGIKIISFELHTFAGRDEVSFSIEGNVVPEEYCQKLSNFLAGEVFYIRNIKAIGREGEKITLNPMRFTISYQ